MASNRDLSGAYTSDPLYPPEWLHQYTWVANSINGKWSLSTPLHTKFWRTFRNNRPFMEFIPPTYYYYSNVRYGGECGYRIYFCEDGKLIDSPTLEDLRLEFITYQLTSGDNGIKY